MCGICGMVGGVSENVLECMLSSMAHRGPDDSGRYVDVANDVGLAHNRLSIIDPGSNGHQPMFSACGQLVLVFNGEIYNYLELRDELSGQYPFSSHTDTEVILAAYLKWGRDCLSHFNGMFAFALWDRREAALWIARDHVGIKPLYYYQRNGILRFASEVRAIFSDSDVPRQIEPEAIDRFLRFRYVRNHSSFHRDVLALPPGHWMAWKAGNLQIKSYWDMTRIEPVSCSVSQAKNRFRELLDDSVRLRLRSDVPLGIFLSGGLDSSLITALAARHSNQVRTFSIQSPGVAIESPQAEYVARTVGSDHTCFECTPEELLSLPDVISAMDMPVGDAIIVPTYLLSQMARQQVKTVLTGEGADELLAGYAHQRQLDTIRRLAGLFRVPGASSLLRLALRVFPRSFWDCFFSYGVSLGKAGINRINELAGCMDNASRRYLAFVSVFGLEERKRLYLGELESFSSDNHYMGLLHRGDLRELIELEATEWLPQNILMKQDGLTMANSLEGRVPFLDHRIIKEVFSWPADLFEEFSKDKAVLRNWLKDLGIQRQPTKKAPFMMDIRGPFVQALKSLVHHYLLERQTCVSRYIRIDMVRKLLADFEESPFVHAKQLSAILCLECHLQRY